MSEVYAVPLNQDHSQVSFNHEFLSALRGRKLQPETKKLYTVGTIRHGSEENTSYLMAKVEHLKAPLDEVDVVEAEKRDTFICGCPGFLFQCYDQQIGAKIDDCKHIERQKKQSKQTADQNQETLV